MSSLFFCRNLLVFQDGQTKFYADINQQNWIYTIPIKLPDHIECTQCILQWRYHAGKKRKSIC